MNAIIVFNVSKFEQKRASNVMISIESTQNQLNHCVWIYRVYNRCNFHLLFVAVWFKIATRSKWIFLWELMIRYITSAQKIILAIIWQMERYQKWILHLAIETHTHTHRFSRRFSYMHNKQQQQKSIKWAIFTFYDLYTESSQHFFCMVARDRHQLHMEKVVNIFWLRSIRFVCAISVMFLFSVGSLFVLDFIRYSSSSTTTKFWNQWNIY